MECGVAMENLELAAEAEQKNEAISGRFVRGPSVELSSSATLDWQNVAVQRHCVQPGEKPEISIPYYMVKLASGQELSRGEREVRRGHFIPYLKPPGIMFFNTEGVEPAIVSSTPTEIIFCALDKNFVHEVVAEQEFLPTRRTWKGAGFHDLAAGTLMRLIEVEAATGGVNGQLYIDHLTYALTLRLISLGTRTDEMNNSRNSSSQNALPLTRLKRVVERMVSDLDTGVDLNTLAAESGYSRNHFLRMFRTATGYTPHQYFLRLRIQKAQELMKDRSVQLIDVALACGFSSHAHLSRVFRHIIGATPSEYRRDHS